MIHISLTTLNSITRKISASLTVLFVVRKRNFQGNIASVMVLCGNRCAGGPDKPSGHTQFCCSTGNSPPCNANTTSSQTQQQEFPSDFAGPYKDYCPPGWREPAVGQQNRGDVPYLPSYLDPLNRVQTWDSGPTDNLFTRGPFFPGVSETHEKFVNRKGISLRKYYEYKRHYEEPGMKYDRSITQTDFVPPFPMLPQDKSPCLPVPPGEVPYAPKRSPPKNPHAKILEYKTVDPELIYVEEEPKREFTTETGDSYICYQKSKSKDPLKTFTSQEKELFLERIHKTHEECPNGFPHKFMCDDKTCESELCSVHKNILCDGGKEDAKETNVKKQDVCERTPWLLHPKNYSFPNGYMILPSKCQQMQGKNI